jgi:uncharacterized membrane protein YhaH (DUF805 family)
MPSEFGRRGAAVGATRGYSRAPEPKSPRAPKANSTQGSTLGHVWGLLFSLDGRIARMQYWLGKLGAAVAAYLVKLSAESMQSVLTASEAEHTVSASLLIFMLIALVALFAALILILWAMFSLQVRRWHDRDKSWTWALLGFVPLVGWLWQTIECGLLDGTPGPNRFGPSPKGVVGGSYEDYYSLPQA